jgi:hypothetical protein
MISIKDFVQKIKFSSISVKNRTYSTVNAVKDAKIENDIFIVLLMILVGTASFGLGKLSALEKQKVPISVLKTKEAMYASVASSPAINAGAIDQTQEVGNQAEANIHKGSIVASKSGTKYYYPSCSGVSRIKEENKVWFNSIEEARSAGLTPAANCPGLQ